MKVAIVHDWFVGWGAEAVVYELHKIYPDAPIYTSYCNSEWRQRLDGKVITGYLQHWPFSRMRKFLPPLRALWFSRLNLSGYDLIISSSGAEAKGVKVKKPAVHINYCHAPTHYYWSRYEEYMKSPGFGPLNFLARLGLKLLVGPMRRWDLKAAQRPDYIIANSSHIKNEIKKYYGREAVIIHPPVDVEAFRPNGKLKRAGFIIAGRQTPYKRFGLAVEACSQLDLPLKVVGGGPDNKHLRQLAGESVEFISTPKTQQEMAHYFQSAQAFIFPGLDDFGIVAVEALAAGTPVIAYRAGGALDYIQPGRTGEFFEDQTIESLGRVLKNFETQNYDHVVIQSFAKQFSAASFRKNIRDFINQACSKVS